MMPRRNGMGRAVFLSSVLAVSASGVAATIGQVVVLRELLVLFHGNELTTGLVFASWLLFTAVGSGFAPRIAAAITYSGKLIQPLLAAAALLLPLTVLWIRAARLIWNIPPGEMVDPLTMVGITISSTALFCFLSGILFGLAWQQLASPGDSRSTRPLFAYIGEAFGAALGGLFLVFILLPRCSFFTGTVMVAFLCTVLAALSGCGGRSRSGEAVRLLALLALSVTLFGLLVAWNKPLDTISRHWQWGRNLITSRDTPFHNLALLKNGDQYTLFANGLPLFSAPDPQSAEHAVHLTLLQHRNPQKVLVIGGGSGEILEEILKHPGISRIDYLEPDPQIVELAEEALPPELTAVFLDPRVFLHHLDAASYIRTAPASYDAILMQLGDPVNAEMNRFYTEEFFIRIAGLLKEDGIFSFSVTSSPTMVGPLEADLLRSLYVTLSNVFPGVLVIPGDHARFFSAVRPWILDVNPQVLLDRAGERRLSLRYVRDYYLFDTLSPMGVNYLQAVLNQEPAVPINRDFQPTCYFKQLAAWAAQIHPSLGTAFFNLSRAGSRHLWLGVAFMILVATVLSWRGRLSDASTVKINVFAVGGVLMVLEVILLLAFQIVEGFVYQQLALIIAFFMAGMATGSAILVRARPRVGNPRRWFITTQTILALHLLFIPYGLSSLKESLQASPSFHLPPGIVFGGLALLSGTLGGLHFSLATQLLESCSMKQSFSGPRLYSLDLAGAVTAVLAATLFLLPVYGLPTTLKVLSALCAGGVLILLPHSLQSTR
jgi:spermidine synthase